MFPWLLLPSLFPWFLLALCPAPVFILWSQTDFQTGRSWGGGSIQSVLATGFSTGRGFYLQRAALYRLRGCCCRARVVASLGLVCGGEGVERVGCLGYGFLGQGGAGRSLPSWACLCHQMGLNHKTNVCLRSYITLA